MPSRQQSPSTSATSGSSSKKAGHQRNPMACTNCRARKIKCDSSKRYPDHPCQRCVTRKLHCEYVAISHNAPSDSRSRSGSLSSTIYPSSSAPDMNGKSRASGAPSQPRYSPLSSSFHSRNSQSEPYPPFDGQYSSSHSSYSDSSPVESTHYYDSYSPSNGNFHDGMMHPNSHMGHMPNISVNLRSPYGGLSSGMPGMLNPGPDPGHYYSRDPGYADWDGLSMAAPPVSQGQYSAGECLCPPALQCTCGNRRYY